MNLKAIIFGCIFCFSTNLWAQKENTAEETIREIFEQYAAEQEEELDFESFYNDLSVLIESPIPLNSAKRDDLEKLPFLSDIQIENILAYIYKQGKLNSLFELQLIDGLDMTDVRRIIPFVTLGDYKNTIEKLYWREIIQYGKSDLMIRFDQTAEKKRGYISTPNDSGKLTTPYLGNPLYNSTKYNFKFKNRLQLGLVMEKDAGEQFWGKIHKTYDSYAAYMQINDLWKFKTIVVGNYRASFGQGLIINMGYGNSKSSYVLNVLNRNNGLKKFSSTDEYNFLKGVGSTIKLNKTEISVFYSYRYMDADTSSGQFSSFYKTGLHRTITEYNKRATVGMQSWGINTSVNLKMARLGFTVLQTSLTNRLEPITEPYNLHYFKGNKLTTAGVDYRLRLGPLNFSGETAMTTNSGIATINTLLFSPLSTVSIVTLWRYYSPKYDTFYANAFSENSRINNENGWYVGAEIRPFNKWKIAIYADSYQFPWLKYGVNAPSTGQDYLLQADFTTKRNVQMLWRLKYEQKQKNADVGIIKQIHEYNKASVRYQLNFTSGAFNSKNLIELNYSDSLGRSSNWGFTAYQDLSYTFEKLALTLNARCMYFDAPNYNNRFYIYEKDILYAFSIPMTYGAGVRYYLNMKVTLFNRLSVWFKVAQTAYEIDRKTIGSSYETIAGNRKTDYRMLIKYDF